MRSETSPEPQAARLPLLDTLRGLAALSVCWYHLTNGFAAPSPVRASGAYGWVGVDVFFVLSGFVIPYVLHQSAYEARRDWRRFLLKRVVRIEPPYLVIALGCIALWHLSSLFPTFRGLPPPDVLSTQLLSHVGYLTGIAGLEWLNPVFWTLAIEFQFYLLMSLAYPVLVSTTTVLRWAVGLCFAALTIAGGSQNYIFAYLGLFSLGISVFQHRVGLIGSRQCMALCLLATLSVAVGQDLLTALIALATALAILWKAKSPCSYLAWLGTISYSLYLVHVPIGGRVVNLGKRFIETPMGELGWSLAALGASLAAAYVLYVLIERPAQRMSRRIRFRDGLPTVVVPNNASARSAG